MDGAIILGARLIPECVAKLLRVEKPFRHVASSTASKGGRGCDFDRSGMWRVPEKQEWKCEYVDGITKCSINLLRRKVAMQTKCFLQLYKSDANFVVIVVLYLPSELGKRDE
jgi:hypothetical protein